LHKSNLGASRELELSTEKEPRKLVEIDDDVEESSPGRSGKAFLGASFFLCDLRNGKK